MNDVIEVDLDPLKYSNNHAVCERLVLAGIPVEIGPDGRIWPKKYGVLRRQANGAFVRFTCRNEE